MGLILMIILGSGSVLLEMAGDLVIYYKLFSLIRMYIIILLNYGAVIYMLRKY